MEKTKTNLKVFKAKQADINKENLYLQNKKMMHCIILTISERAAINSEQWRQRSMKNSIKTTTTMTDNNKVGKSEKTNSIITKQVKEKGKEQQTYYTIIYWT